MRNHDFISDVERYCGAAGISPSTLGVRAIGNSRFLDRFKRRVETLAEDESRIRAYMAANPAPSISEASE